MTDDPVRPARRRRWILRAVLGLLVLAVLLALFGPKLAAPVVRGLVVGRLNAALNGSASLEELSFDWGGSLHAGGFVLEAEDGLPLATLAALDAEIGVLKLARRDVELDLRLRGLELDLRRAPDGSWNFERVVPESAEPESRPGPEAPPEEPGSGSLPQVRTYVELRDSRVRVHADGAVTTLEELEFTLELASLEERAPFALTARVVGPGGPAGALDVHGELALAHEGRIGADTIEALLEATLESLELAEIAPLASGGTERTSVTNGTLQAKASANVGRGPTLDARFDLALDGLALGGPTGPLGLASLRIGARAELGIAPGTTTSAGTLRIEGGTSGLELRDAAGAALELAGMEEARFELTAALDGAAGSLELERCELAAGPVSANARASLAGIALDGSASGLELIEAHGQVDADLRVLAEVARRVAGIGEIASGDTLALRAEVRPRDGRLAAQAELALRGLRFASPGAQAGAPQDLSLSFVGELDSRAGGRSTIERFALESSFLDIEGSGEAFDVLDPKLARGTFATRTRLDPAAASTVLAPWLGGYALTGAEVVQTQTLALEAGSIAVESELTLEQLAVRGPALGARELELSGVALQAVAQVGVESKSARVTQLALTLPGVDVKASGELAGLGGGAAELAGQWRIEPSVDLAAVGAWATPLLGSTQLAGGQISGAIDLRLETGKGSGTGTITGKGVDVTLAVEGKEEPARIAEDELASSFELGLELESGAVALERFTLQSETLSMEASGRVLPARPDDPAARSRFESVQGTGTYVPARLSSWLRPWLPGELRGAEHRPFEFAFSGEMAEADVLATLRALRGEAHVELGELALAGLTLSGKLGLNARGDELGLAGTMDANGGQMGLDARLDLRDPAQLGAGASAPASTFGFTFAGVEARPELAPLLAYVHPLFGALEAAGAGSLTGRFSGEIELRYGAPLTKELLGPGLSGLDHAAVDGDGRIEFDELSLKGSPLLSSMVALIDPKRGGELAIEPVRLAIRAGRVGYDKPWQWTIAGSPTRFSGTLGLDGTLSMAWQVPVTPELVQRHGFLRYFEGEVIEVPLEGSVQRPTLGLEGVLDGLARSALEREVKERLGGVLPDLGGVLGGGAPDELLRRADDLHAKGETAEAAKLYRELREKHVASLTYLLNKSRIDERAGR